MLAAWCFSTPFYVHVKKRSWPVFIATPDDACDQHARATLLRIQIFAKLKIFLTQAAKVYKLLAITFTTLLAAPVVACMPTCVLIKTLRRSYVAIIIWHACTRVFSFNQHASADAANLEAVKLQVMRWYKSSISHSHHHALFLAGCTSDDLHRVIGVATGRLCSWTGGLQTHCSTG